MLALWVALSLHSRMGSKTLRALFEHFSHEPRAILQANADALCQVPGVGPKTAQSIRTCDVASIEQLIPRWIESGIQLAVSFQPGAAYPQPLLTIPDPPPMLLMRGQWQPVYARAVAVVGTRTPSPLAEDITFQLGQRLAQQQITVVSGLAAGIDTLAHQGALDHPDGTTIGVIGSGLHNIYPHQNRGLAQRCVERGLLLSEIAPNATPTAARLVARNRLITGLAQAVVVVETSEDGGAMHAVRFAQQQGRPVYAFGLSASGNQNLLQQGVIPLHPDLSDLDLLFDLIH